MRRYIVAQNAKGVIFVMKREQIGEVEVYVEFCEVGLSSEKAGTIADALNAQPED